MFAKLAAFSSIALLVAAGGPPPATTTVTVTAPPTSTSPATSCSPGPVQCCNSVLSSSSFLGGFILALLGIDLSLPNIPIGLNCSPLSIIGIPSASCNGEAVCCENNDFGGLVVLGCSPVNIFL